MRRQAHVARPQLKLRIALARRRAGRKAVRLSEVLSLFPLRYGLLELNAFIELATRRVPSRFDPAQVAVTRLIDEHEDPVGLKTCTFFDPIFLASGEPGAGVEDIHCLVPEDGAVDPNAWWAIEQDGLRACLSAVVDNARVAETMMAAEET
jgi:hypothetical protein